MPRNLLTPDALTMMDVIARTGSFAAAARELGKVPSALTYNVRQLEDALDVLLFDRRSGQAQMTAAGEELLYEGRRLLEQMDAVANRVKRVACGWETQLTIAVNDLMSRPTVFELCEHFFALRTGGPADRALKQRAREKGGVAVPVELPLGEPPAADSGPGTRLRLRTEVLAGTWEALLTGNADLAIGVDLGHSAPAGVKVEMLGTMGFVFAVAPHHPLATHDEPIGDSVRMRHRAVAVADSAQRLAPITVNLLPGQDVFTVPTMQSKLEAHLRGLGCGYLPEPIAREHIAAGRLVVRTLERVQPPVQFGYAWRSPMAATPAAGEAASGTRTAPPNGLALRWWLDRLESPATRLALLERHAGPRPMSD
jgi:DNA-binding transcriptional LysR family regulator